ncbi:TetR/AcrR family transcriptional regulator (plasmid) [Caballeronia sp. NK8]|uniref:TetR/AcrR family transcriptional regulator n=1 Tax=Caballeronia sp. NK8 TaxID=140098 RepID=UPI001BB7A8F4|nr:TetR/AcrR family transcriptional regulator [Caballeronia sp. NK8]BCQ29146.1 TetR/AcrR family transcriptional regulator [Caballeronia sp. NK8]
MTTSLKSGSKPGRGRPRAFDPEAGLAVGQRMFHAAGYDAVGLSALTTELGITPPSFYTAFGSKAAFFQRVLERYANTELALADILLPHRPASEALADLLERAARTYAHDPERTGCLVLEAARGHSECESAVLARQVAERRRAQIRAFVAKTHPRRADAATDYVATVMSGLSGSAREGMSAARLVKVAKAAGVGLAALLG